MSKFNLLNVVRAQYNHWHWRLYYNETNACFLFVWLVVFCLFVLFCSFAPQNKLDTVSVATDQSFFLLPSDI